MVALQLTGPDLSRRQAPAERPATLPAPFQLLDPGIVNDAIPAFFIGRNREGFWVAREVRGRIGGIFLFENSAVSFARRNSRPAGCATIYPTERIELDLADEGNPLVPHLRSAVRLVKRFCVRALMVLVAGGAVAAVIAVKTAVYLSRLNY